MTHHLVAYVCQVVGTQSQHGEVDAIVLARHESPGFSLISYRRCGNNASDAGCDLPAIEVASRNTFATVDFETTITSTSNDRENGPYPPAVLRHPDLYEAKPPHTHSTQHHAQSKHDHVRQHALHGVYLKSYRHQEETAVNPIRHMPDDDQEYYLWQLGSSARRYGFHDKGQHLTILWRFIQSLSLDSIGFDVGTMDKGIQTFWLRAAAALRESKPSSSTEIEHVVHLFLRGMFQGSFAPSGAKAPLSRESAIIRVTTHLFLRALFSYTIQCLLLSTCMAQSNSASTAQLQERFVLLLSEVYDILVDILREVTTDMADELPGNQELLMPALVDEVLSLVYSKPRFAELRVELSSVLLSRQRIGSLPEILNRAFHTFVTLVREATVVPLKHLAEGPGLNNLKWNQRWLLAPGSLQVAHVGPGAKQDSLRLADIAQFVYECGCIDITIAADLSSLSIQSACSLSSSATAATMDLILDGSLRAFRTLPSGISSTVMRAGGWFIGDYTATCSEDTRLLNVDLFLFTDDNKSVVAHGDRWGGEPLLGKSSHDVTQIRRISLSIKVEEDISEGVGSTSDLFAFVDGIVYYSTYTTSSKSVMELVQGLNLSEVSRADRAEVWRGSRWIEMWKLQVGYIALPQAVTSKMDGTRT
ncbi:unnamed protein product [Phytophthora fragariaefolia]|uniref:Unnamed protein product n=1 Tax=Phytophthora fragariaefolia TaxID=1490495 RepID=A0A9W6XL92_9STRA|nr:unnamed protein product [Phytophthora fragariaefolia]